MPSTTSSSVSAVFASSTVITPSLPTFCIACAIILPIELSPFDEMVATCAISSDDFTFLALDSMSFTTWATARSTPALQIHRVHASRDGLCPLAHDRGGQYGRRRR